MKIFVLGLSIGLFTTTLLGMAIAILNRNTRRVTAVMLVLGALIPIVLLKI